MVFSSLSHHFRVSNTMPVWGDETARADIQHHSDFVFFFCNPVQIKQQCSLVYFPSISGFQTLCQCGATKRHAPIYITISHQRKQMFNFLLRPNLYKTAMLFSFLSSHFRVSNTMPVWGDETPRADIQHHCI